MKLLDEKGLTTVWAAIKNTFLTKSDASSYSLKGETVKNIIIQKNGYTQGNSGASQVLHIFKANGEDEWLTIENASSDVDGFMSRKDKVKLDGIALNANNYSLPLAATSTRGGIQLGYSQNGKNYPVQLSDEKAYVNVPWTNTWRGIQDNLTSSSTSDSLSANQGRILKGLVDSKANSNKAVNDLFITNHPNLNSFSLLNIDGEEIHNANLNAATSEVAGAMSAADKAKLDNIAAGANNYTLPTASDTTLGGIKVSTNHIGTSWPISVDENGIANTCISGLGRNEDNDIDTIAIEGLNLRTVYNEDGVQITYKNSDKLDTEFSFPSESGTFALTSDIPDVSSLCKFNSANDIELCVYGRINFMTPIGDVNLDSISHKEGIIIFANITGACNITCSEGFVYNDDYIDNNKRVEPGRFLITVDGNIAIVLSL